MVDYASTHGGLDPRHVTSMSYLANCACRPIVELGAISYVTDKGDGPAVYRHEFDRVADDGGTVRGPYLIEPNDSGSFDAGPRLENAFSLGVLVDLEDSGGWPIMFGPGPIWVASDESGDRVVLCAPGRIRYGIENRPGSPSVKNEGIVG